MSLSDLLTRDFPAAARLRGDHYANIGRVRIVRATTDEVDAIATGSDEYRVRLTRSGDAHITITAACDCPYFADKFVPCKHMWAVLRVADRKGLLKGPADARAISATLELIDMDGLIPELPDAVLPPQPVGSAPRVADAAGDFVNELRGGATSATAPAPFRYEGGELLYIFDVPTTLSWSGDLALEVMWRKRKKDGEWSIPKTARVAARELHLFPEADREVLARLVGATPTVAPAWTSYAPTNGDGASWFALPRVTLIALTELIASTGRSFVRVRHGEDPHPVEWDDRPWRFRPIVDAGSDGTHVDGVFERLTPPAESLAVHEPVLVLSRGLLFTRDSVARLERSCDFSLIAALRRTGPVDVPAGKQSGLAEGLARAGVPAEQLPDALRVATVEMTPRPRLSLRRSSTSSGRLRADMSFDYDGFLQGAGGARVVFDAERRRMITRNLEAEAAALRRLDAVGFAPYLDGVSRNTVWEVGIHQLMSVVRALTGEGWHVSAEGRVYQSPKRVNMTVTSGIDWFDLTATVEFGDETIPLADVLTALRRREVMVRLGNGTVGLLPDDWLKRYGPLAATGEITEDGLRFKPSQAALLDVLLAAQAEHGGVTIDDTFAKARQRLHDFDRVRDAEPPPTFQGTLRPYQREGLGWLQFLRQFSFGGCLADDMGLGKTIMVLALLEQLRTTPLEDESQRRPSLIVVPRSLVHNWHSEAAKFAPGLRVLDYSGATRSRLVEPVRDVDIILSTYGTLRRDVEHLRTMEFEYVILDESQAIKNSSTVAAKAVRLLRARHRLALSGTPIENHLGELWSLFDFLNPGLLGTAAVFQGSTGMMRPDAETLASMARGLRPFILRRTKEQVASDLPRRTEQTLVCDLDTKQRNFYNSVRAHYRQSLLTRVDRDGLAKSKMHILEALLRLRQAACHPGLVDKTKEDDPSAKLDLLVPRLIEIAESGHKALVFSQFTSLLALLRRRLADTGLAYEYLDGRTRDRKRRVERFQSDPLCPLFLISLKAGGVGLNLTAAGYVFLLDPWWNPAVEAQAIDRAHRIGQTREVFAYRLIAKDTVEEKVVELQQSKRALADAILSADAGGITGITREELAALLS